MFSKKTVDRIIRLIVVLIGFILIFSFPRNSPLYILGFALLIVNIVTMFFDKTYK